MSIECYYRHCSYHSCREDLDDGPICHERECKITERQRAVFQRLRNRELSEFKRRRENENDAHSKP